MEEGEVMKKDSVRIIGLLAVFLSTSVSAATSPPLLWSYELENANEEVSSLAISADGSVIVTGTTGSRTGYFHTHSPLCLPNR